MQKFPKQTATPTPLAWPAWKFWSLVGIIIIGISSGAYVILDQLSQNLPNPEELETYDPYQVTKIYSSDNKLIHELFSEKRLIVPLAQIPQYLIDALLATEDRTFYDHWGVSFQGFLRAVKVNLSTMSYEEGFSTLTMQLSRGLYLTSEKKLVRKFKEILTTLQIERTYSKDEILEMYLNNSYFGVGTEGVATYGVFSAANSYFGKRVDELTLAESALLIAQLRGPTYYSPIRKPEAALAHRNVVLKNMLDVGYITNGEFAEAIGAEIVLKDQGNEDFADLGKYFTEHVRLELQNMQEKVGFDLWRDGVTVYTTLDTRLQSIAEKYYQLNLQNVQRRVSRRIPAQLVELGLQPADIDTTVQGAFIALDAKTGSILAMIGGRDFNKYKFNCATQALRQPGSTFKIFPYTAAIDNGYSPVTQLLNQPVVLYNVDGTRWAPSNYDNEPWGGLTTLRYGLRRSMNIISVRIVQELIPPEQIIGYARRMGITTPIEPFPAVCALGGNGLKLIEMTSAFGVCANHGIWTKPSSILKIVDRHGQTIYEHTPEQREALSEETAYIMTNMFQTVADIGTGQTARSVYGFRHPAAGKTGTTNDFTDGWFIGFTPHIVAGVWTGMDNFALKLGQRESGALVALPAWAQFMRDAHETLELPPDDFQRPPGIEEKVICEDTLKPATRYCPRKFKEIFNRKYLPKGSCNLHTGVTLQR
jgi:penicillin-binding protein 1A